MHHAEGRLVRQRKMSNARRRRALFLIACLCAVGFLHSGATASASDVPAPVHTFRPGFPDEPRWTMLRVELDRPGVEVWMNIEFTDMRCPMTWGFVWLEGAPGSARWLDTTVFDFAYGQEGVVASASRDGTAFHRSSVEADGAERCPTSPGWNLRWTQLPAGELHLLVFAAGQPFASVASLRAPEGGLRVTGVASGNETFYVDATSFSRGDAHVAAFSPGFDSRPSTAPEGSFWDPQGYKPGGTHGSAQVSLDRSASLTFQNQPLWGFINQAQASVSEATVTGPAGRVWTQEGRGMAGVDGASVNGWGIEADGRRDEYPPGTYEFTIHKSAGASRPTPAAWHVWGVDFRFP